MNQLWLYIDSFAQHSYSGDPETPVAPDQIDCEKNLHVYLTGNIPKDRSVSLRANRQAPPAPLTKASDQPRRAPTAQTYKASLPHYSLSAKSDYLLSAVDDNRDPWAI